MRRWLVFATLLLMLHSCSSIPLLQFRGRAEGKATNPLGDLLQNRSIIFIGGLHRSGTSFLNYLIGSNPEASTFYGTNVPENEGQHLQRVYPSDQRVLFNNLVLDPAVQCGIQKGIFPGARREMSWNKGYFTHSLFASAQLGHLTESSSLITQQNRQKLLKSWQLHWDFKRQMLVEKTPANIIRTRFLQEMFGSERSQFLLTMRHPLTQVSPELDCNYFALVKEYFQQFVLTWYYWVPLDIVHLAKSTIFRYEDLAKDPLGAATDLYEALGLPPHQPELLMPEPTTTRKLLIFHGTAGVNQGTSFRPEAREGWVKNWQDIRSQCPNILESLIPFEKYLKPFGYSLYEPFILPTDLSGLFPGIDIQTSRRRSPQGPLAWKPSRSTLEDRILHHTLNSELLSC